jgi:uncharacterized protein
VSKIKLKILGLSSSQSQSGSFALVLGEEKGKGNRRLPIIIGMFEAQAIAIEIEKIIPNRPMTHDLFKSFADSFGFSVLEVYISELREGVFYAKIICTDGKSTIEIDARPSDAIAISLRFSVPIFTNEAIMSEAGIVLTEVEEEEVEEETEPINSKDQLKRLPIDQLQVLLTEALDNEDYERAAQVRDEINRRN